VAFRPHLLPLFVTLPLLGLASWSGRSDGSRAEAAPPSAPSASARYAEGPPPAHTGGFGEPTCHSCHFDNPLNDIPGRLTVRGLPERYTPGERYQIVISLTRPGMQRAGFQAAVRYAGGSDPGRGAGELLAAGDRVRLVDSAGVRYAQQTVAGTRLMGVEATEWTLEWRAPRDGGGVVLHLAANAANGDQSEFGDHIYSRAVTVARAQGEK
jgi:hypothetical protein